MHPLLRSKLTTAALAALTLWMGVLVGSAGIRRYTSASDLGALEARIDDAQRENQRLEGEIARMQKPQWLTLELFGAQEVTAVAVFGEVIGNDGIQDAQIQVAGAKPGEVRAFDTGPGNMVLDQLTEIQTGGRLRYDRDGRIAASGRIDRALLDRLLQDH